MDDPIMIDAHDIRFSYDGPGGRRSLNGAQLHVSPGEFVAVLGHNGCGKSTLAKHFNAILLPESGKVYVEGMDTADEEKLYDIRQTVGMVFQSPDNQIVATVVEEDVAFALENLGVPQNEMRRRVDDSMKMAGIYEYRERAPHNLSGGQKQRVAIAGVVAMRPDCLILDEATANIDTETEVLIQDSLEKMKNIGTMLIVAHRLSTIQHADNIILLSHGEIMEQGTHQELLHLKGRYYQLYTLQFRKQQLQES